MMMLSKGRIRTGSLTPAQEDKDALIMLRKKIMVNEDQYHLGYIDDKEYNKVLADCNAAITALEAKYGIR